MEQPAKYQATPAGLTPTPRLPARTPLEELHWHWGEAYRIGYDEHRGWWAARRDQIGALLTAADPGKLHQSICDDYDAKPVPRDAASTEPGQ
jgi:hypothetical protein